MEEYGYSKQQATDQIYYGGLKIYAAVDINNYQNLTKGYESGSAATDATYELVVDGVDAGLRQLYQLLDASKTFDLSLLKIGIETVLGII